MCELRSHHDQMKVNIRILSEGLNRFRTYALGLGRDLRVQ
jgi:hypothetical protein